MKRHCRLQDKRGFILVSVLISTALLLTMATGLAWTAKGAVEGASALRFSAETRSVAETALKAIGKSIAADSNSYDSFTEPLYSQTEPLNIRIGKYLVLAVIEPLDGRISAAGLFLPDGVTIRSEYEFPWKKIWEDLGLEDMEAKVSDFMDIDRQQRPGSIDGDMWINRPVFHISELRMIDGLEDTAIYGSHKNAGSSISDYISVYGTEKININTAPAHVVAALDKRIDIESAKMLEYYRIKTPVEKIDDLKNIPGFPVSVISKIKNIIKFKSDYFLIRMTVQTENGNTRNFRVTVKKEDGTVKTVRWEE